MSCLVQGTGPDQCGEKKLERREVDWLPIIVEGRLVNRFVLLVERLFRVAGANAPQMQNQKLSDDRRDPMVDTSVLDV